MPSRAYELQNDPTVFSRVRHQYQDFVSCLLEGPASRISSGITSTDLEIFREIYGVSAFQCRYYNCPQAVRSFASRREREEHERRHARRLRCADPNCTFYAAGFKSRSSVKNHNAKYHAQADDGDVPDRVTFTSDRRRHWTSVLENQRQSPLQEMVSHEEERRSPLQSHRLAACVDVANIQQQTQAPQGVSLLPTAQKQQGLNTLQSSSFWSLREEQFFRRLVDHFGTNWQAIAESMKTKTSVMVCQDPFLNCCMRFAVGDKRLMNE